MVSETALTGKQTVRVALASFIGTTIEWYDFMLFGMAASLVFNTLFFPSLSPVAGTLAAFATFGVAFLARPLGGIVFGHFGDRIGRKAMLVLTLLLMGFGTAAIGMLPTFESVGIWAPIMLTALRFVQGIAVGGEWGGAALMAVEHASPGRRAFYGSWPQAGVPAGLLLSSLAFWLVESMPEESLMAWGWRIPFLASLVLVVVGLYIRLSVSESPDFAKVKESGASVRIPLMTLMRTRKKNMLIGIGAQAGTNIPFYLASVFVLSYGPDIGLSQGSILLAMIIATFVDIPLVPWVASFADRYGRRRILGIGAIYMAAVSFPFFWLIESGSQLGVIIAMILILTFGHALTYASISAFLAELFEPQIRYSGASISYQVGGMVTSGPAPLIAASLLAATGGTWSIALYIILSCVVTFVAIAAARNTWTSTPEESPRKATVEAG
ncbi:MAG: MFS transporter [Pseudonocardiaceae bacterium]|nr:MFS transporter [Pseudonocardiaceae bacterium]